MYVTCCGRSPRETCTKQFSELLKERWEGCFWVTYIQVPSACPGLGLRLFMWSEAWKQKVTGAWDRQQSGGRVRSWYPKALFNCNFILSKVIQNVFTEFLYQAYHSAGHWFCKCECNSIPVLEIGKWKWIILLIFTLWFKKSQDTATSCFSGVWWRRHRYFQGNTVTVLFFTCKLSLEAQLGVPTCPVERSFDIEFELFVNTEIIFHEIIQQVLRLEKDSEAR